VLYNDELRDGYAAQKPFRDWLKAETIDVRDLAMPREAASAEDADVSLTQRLARHGYHFDDIWEVVHHMAQTGSVPLASMGTDVPPAVLSRRPRSFFDYFNELFAQVTNPPIDALRESLVTSDVLYLGNHGNLLEDARDTCRVIRLAGPILSDEDFARICGMRRVGFRVERFRAVYSADGGPRALEQALDELDRAVEAAVRDGANIVVISDRAAEGEVPIPSLLSLGSVHNHLIRAGVRMRADLVVETGDAISPHDFATLVGYSASGIHPYLAHECIGHLVRTGSLPMGTREAMGNYDHAVTAGIMSIMSKMGISAMQGYHSAQIFEILGLSDDLVERCFAGTTSRIGGLDLQGIKREIDERQRLAGTLEDTATPARLASSGITKWRPGTEEHLITPQAIYLLQRACREGSYELFREYAKAVRRPGRAIVLRDLLELVPLPTGPVSLDEVEPVESIVRRFNTGAMSFGSLSKEAHECLAIAMNRLGGRSNTGEGGEDPTRETPLPSGDSLNSAIKQVASGRFGVTSRYLVSAREIQIKMAQGAKPGEGGHLPGRKVWPWVARIRHSTPGVSLISPPPHHDIYSIEDLAELIFDLKCANPQARISVKLVSEAGVGTIATGVAKGGAAKILVSGSNGGTGAAPRDSIYHAGLPLELGLAETQQTLIQNGLRSRVVLEADGKLMDGRDVAVAALLGAEEFGFATMPLVSMGCLMQRDCHQDTCPVGICTQDGCLRGRFAGRPEHVINFMTFVAQDLREQMARLGFRTMEQMVGHPECLRQVEVEGHPKANGCDLSALLHSATPQLAESIDGADGVHFLPQMAADLQLERTLDATLFVPYTASARDHMVPVRFGVDIDNVNRCVGTMLGAAVTAAHPEGLPEGAVTIDCRGSGGQSFGAFLPRGITLNIEGDANDYVGKGLSGGIVSVRPNARSTYKFDENVSVGNVAFYGATSGKGFVNGLAGQRFGVRNSGATLVVEGVGNHGCEYMTGGVAVVLGEVGSNFAAGMSGGVAYVYDELRTLDGRCNHDMVDLVQPTDAELERVRELIEEHVRRTSSPRGIKLLYQFADVRRHFVKVIPHEYRLIMEQADREQVRGVSREKAVELAFESLRREA
jgi:glutamate synthase (ferredoxin)